MCHLKGTILFESLNLFFFYMPWFFFKSGMFCSAERKDPYIFLKNNAKKFLLPCLVFSLIGSIIAIISSFVCDGSAFSVSSVLKSECVAFFRHGSTGWNGPLWFLITLCLVRVVFNFLRNVINHYAFVVLLLCLAYLHYFFFANRGLWWGGNFSSGLVFYILGMKLSKLQYNKFVVAISFVILLLIGITKPTIVTMFGNFLLNDGIYLLWYPFCLAGIIVFNNLIKFIGFLFVHYHFDDIGRNSMLYYVLHYPLGFLVCDVYNYLSPSPNNWELLVYLCIMWFGMLPLITYMINSKHFSFMLGK